MTEQLKGLYVPEDTVAAVSAGEKLKEAFSEVTVSTDEISSYWIIMITMIKLARLIIPSPDAGGDPSNEEANRPCLLLLARWVPGPGRPGRGGGGPTTPTEGKPLNSVESGKVSAN